MLALSLLATCCDNLGMMSHFQSTTLQLRELSEEQCQSERKIAHLKAEIARYQCHLVGMLF